MASSKSGEEAGLANDLHEILHQTFGYREFRGPQQEIIQHVIGGGHALLLAPTGMGKSLCFQIPAILFSQQDSASNPLTVVISPLIALMLDQVQALRSQGVAATFVNSSLDRKTRETRYAEIHDGKFSLLYVTPERFRKPEFLKVINDRRVKLLAVDEAHCISQWGHDFRPDYSRLKEIRQELNNPTTIALTATATPDVQADIIEQLGLTRDQVEFFFEGIDRPNLELRVEPVWDDDDKLQQILNAFESLAETGSGIVYFSLIRTLERFSDLLTARSVDHLVYHGDLSSSQRRALQEEFTAARQCLVLATNAFGLGIDKPDIRFVLHAEVPGSMESYYQEIGRAGRDGEPAFCQLLYSEADLETQMEFIRWSHPDPMFYQRVYDFLENEIESINAFGMGWLRERLHAHNRHDFRLETALNMLERQDAISGFRDREPLQVVGPLPPKLIDDDFQEERLSNARKKLLALVQYANHEGDRRQLIHDYFGIPSGSRGNGG